MARLRSRVPSGLKDFEHRPMASALQQAEQAQEREVAVDEVQGVADAAKLEECFVAAKAMAACILRRASLTRLGSGSG